ncbi:MAG: hypothetical protein J0653_01625, partial [Deltaproteobacteria bacterium]|nr:hypothetical protein [Deltaproteobacteria bacterium]
FLDYDSVIQPGSPKEKARLQLLSRALKGQLCSVVITSEIRQGLTPEELAKRMSLLGGRHISATPVLDPEDSYGTRNAEIREWLRQHKVTSICIIDGSKTGLPVKPVWVSRQYGLNQVNFVPLRYRELENSVVLVTQQNHSDYDLPF